MRKIHFVPSHLAFEQNMTSRVESLQAHSSHHLSQIFRLLLFGAPLLVVAVVLGRSLGQDWLKFEQWITQLGFWGPLVLILVTALVPLLLFPDSPFAMAAGALFGLGWGSVYAVVGVLLGTTVTFWFSRLLLQSRVRRHLNEHPRWSAIEGAASREGVRLQLLIRLTPLHSAVFSYVMGASHISYGAFAVGCLAMIPGLIVEAYCGHIAGHLAGLASGTSTHSIAHTVATVCGLLTTIVVMTYVGKMANRAIAESEAKSAFVNDSIAT